MFKHSIPVHSTYRNASKILQNVKEKGHELEKELLLISNKIKVKQLKSLLIPILENYLEINTVLEGSQLLEKDDRLNPWLARVLLYVILWSNAKLKGGKESKPVQTMLLYCKELQKRKKAINSQVGKPRFARINTLKIAVNDAVDKFRVNNWTLVEPVSNTYEDFVTKVSSLGRNEFMVDFHVKEMLVFPPKTPIRIFKGLRSKLVQQNKDQCLPVTLLNPRLNSVVLDMCAALGRKTAFLAAKMKNQGKIYAVEHDEECFERFNEHINKTGATCIETIHMDALKVTDNECPNVEYILLNPACSRSGMTKRIAASEKPSPSAEHLKKFSGPQMNLLKHALSNFPNAKRVVYSTCSIYSEENECVVEEVLKCNETFKLVSARNVLEGKAGNQVAKSITANCLNFRYDKDKTNGFFIAVFERRSKSEQARCGEIKKSEVNQKKKQKSSETNLNESSNLANLPTHKKRKHDSEGLVQNEVQELIQEVELPLKKKHKVKQIKAAEKQFHNGKVVDEQNIIADVSQEDTKKNERKFKDIYKSPKKSRQTNLNEAEPKRKNKKNNKSISTEPIISEETVISKKKMHKIKQLKLSDKHNDDVELASKLNEDVNCLSPKKKKKNKKSLHSNNSKASQLE